MTGYRSMTSSGVQMLPVAVGGSAAAPEPASPRSHLGAAGGPLYSTALPVNTEIGNAGNVDRGLLHGVRVLIVDDCTLHRDNLAALIAANGAEDVVVAGDLESLTEALRGSAVGIVLLNVATAGSALLLRAAKEIAPHLRVVVIGVSEDDEVGIVACAEAGAAGYHTRNESIEELLILISKVDAGESACSPRVSGILLRRLSTLAAQRPLVPEELGLTARETEILRMLERGLSNREIAERLCIAVHTVKNHVHSLLNKLGVSTRGQAAALADSFR
ncbi:MAG: response regulator transcription factor [Mycobacterium sp.]